MARIIGYIKNIPAGTGQNSVTVELKKKLDDSTVASDTTATDGYSYADDGEFAFEVDGSPGPTYVTATYGGQTKVRNSRESGSAGTWYPAEHPYYDEPRGDGVLLGVANELAVTASGAMSVSVNTGAGLVKGHLYRCTSSTVVSVSAADGSNPRIDRLVLRLTRIGQTQEGKIELAVIAGTPASSPTAAALTQTTATWEISLAQIRVNAGVTGIASDKITDERPWSLANPLTTAGDLAYLNASKKPTRLAIGSSGDVLLVSGGVPSWGSSLVVKTLAQSSSDVSSTTDALSWKTAATLSVTLPTGTWTVHAVGGLQLLRSSGGADTCSWRIAVGATGGTERSLTIGADDYLTVIDNAEVSSVASGSVDITVQFQQLSAGTIAARNPWVIVNAVRSA